MKITDKDFVKLVERFVFKNLPEDLNKLASFKALIPIVMKNPQLVYRGMVLDKDMVEAIQGGYRGFSLKTPSSWTPSAKVAEEFVSGNRSIATKNSNSMGVIFKKKPTPNQIILNISSYAMMMDTMGILDQFDFDESTKDMAFQEGEVLLDKGISLSAASIHKTIKL